MCDGVCGKLEKRTSKDLRSPNWSGRDLIPLPTRLRPEKGGRRSEMSEGKGTIEDGKVRRTFFAVSVDRNEGIHELLRPRLREQDDRPG